MLQKLFDTINTAVNIIFIRRKSRFDLFKKLIKKLKLATRPTESINMDSGSGRASVKNNRVEIVGVVNLGAGVTITAKSGIKNKSDKGTELGMGKPKRARKRDRRWFTRQRSGALAYS